MVAEINTRVNDNEICTILYSVIELMKTHVSHRMNIVFVALPGFTVESTRGTQLYTYI